jgi:hypothetical protein
MGQLIRHNFTMQRTEQPKPLLDGGTSVCELSALYDPVRPLRIHANLVALEDALRYKVHRATYLIRLTIAPSISRRPCCGLRQAAS